MTSGDDKQDLQEFVFLCWVMKYTDDSVGQAFRVIPASRRTSPW